MVLCAGLLAGCSGDDDGGDGEARQATTTTKPDKDAEKEPSYPDRWDPRVSRFAKFVESKRDLEFRHPVHVDFLTEDAFRTEVTSEKTDLTEEEKADLAALEGLGRALGLIRGDFDLLKAANDLAGEGVLAFYDPDTKRVTVRGKELTVGVEVTLVHELTHALQDQHFDLSRLGELDSDGANSAMQAVIEGDATRVGDAWLEQLSDGEQRQYDEEQAELGEDAAKGLASVPEWLVTAFTSPYSLGLSFVDAVVAEGKEKAVDAAIKTPPPSEEQIVDPERYFAKDDPAKVEAPRPEPGQEHVDDSDFGVVGWLVVLAERLPARQVIAAADGWGGDAFLTYTEDGRNCVAVRVVGDTDKDTGEFLSALEAWVEGLDGASASRDGRYALLRSCDAGRDTPATDRPPDAAGPEAVVSQVAIRSHLYAEMLSSGAPRSFASCYSQAVTERYSIDELNSDEAPPDFEDQLNEIARACPR